MDKHTHTRTRTPHSLPDRIDFVEAGDRWTVTKFWRVRGRDRVLNGPDHKPPEFDIQVALAWCRANGYTVHQWPGGARAWRSAEPWPVRRAHEIVRVRARLDSEWWQLSARAHSQDDWRRVTNLRRLLAHDLAFDG